MASDNDMQVVLYDLDHVIPLSRGGLHDDANPRHGVGALIQRGGRAVAGMLTIATAGGS